MWVPKIWVQQNSGSKINSGKNSMFVSYKKSGFQKMWVRQNFVLNKNLVQIYLLIQEIWVLKTLGQKNDHTVPYQWITLYILAMDPVHLGHSVSCDYIDHPVSYDYGSPCIMWLWITSYSLTNTNDHSVSFDNGQPIIGGCCPISQVGQIRNFNN